MYNLIDNKATISTENVKSRKKSKSRAVNFLEENNIYDNVPPSPALEKLFETTYGNRLPTMRKFGHTIVGQPCLLCEKEVCDLIKSATGLF